MPRVRGGGGAFSGGALRGSSSFRGNMNMSVSSSTNVPSSIARNTALPRVWAPPPLFVDIGGQLGKDQQQEQQNGGSQKQLGTRFEESIDGDDTERNTTNSAAADAIAAPFVASADPRVRGAELAFLVRRIASGNFGLDEQKHVPISSCSGGESCADKMTLLTHGPLGRGLCRTLRLNDGVCGGQGLAKGDLAWLLSPSLSEDQGNRLSTAANELHMTNVGTMLPASLVLRPFLAQVRALNLQSCQVVDDGDTKVIAECLPHLRVLDLSRTSITNATIETLAFHCSSHQKGGNVGQMLRSLSVFGCTAITDSCADALGRIPLRRLNAARTKVTDFGVCHALRARGVLSQHLRRLCLDQTSVTDAICPTGTIGRKSDGLVASDEIFPALSNCPALEHFSAFETNISDSAMLRLHESVQRHIKTRQRVDATKSDMAVMVAADVARSFVRTVITTRNAQKESLRVGNQGTDHHINLAAAGADWCVYSLSDVETDILLDMAVDKRSGNSLSFAPNDAAYFVASDVRKRLGAPSSGIVHASEFVEIDVGSAIKELLRSRPWLPAVELSVSEPVKGTFDGSTEDASVTTDPFHFFEPRCAEFDRDPSAPPLTHASDPTELRIDMKSPTEEHEKQEISGQDPTRGDSSCAHDIIPKHAVADSLGQTTSAHLVCSEFTGADSREDAPVRRRSGRPRKPVKLPVFGPKRARGRPKKVENDVVPSAGAEKEQDMLTQDESRIFFSGDAMWKPCSNTSGTITRCDSLPVDRQAQHNSVTVNNLAASNVKRRKVLQTGDSPDEPPALTFGARLW